MTSLALPLRICPVILPSGGALGLTLCPGKYQPWALPGAEKRDLAADIKAITDWGARILVTLIEDHEFERAGVTDLPAAAKEAGLDWVHLPIRDMDVPGLAFEHAWEKEGPRLHGLLSSGGRVVIHCMGGLGRTGTIAARILVESGMNAADAMACVRAARPGSIENELQESYVLGLDKD